MRVSTTRAILVPTLLTALAVGCAQRDDTTGSTRRFIATQLGVSYDAAAPAATLQSLGLKETEIEPMLRGIEATFSVKISREEFDGLAGAGGWDRLRCWTSRTRSATSNRGLL